MTLISEFLSQSHIEIELVERCNAVWKRALELDEVRVAFAGATTGGDGLNIFDGQMEGQEKIVTDINVLQDLVDKSVELAQSIVALLDEVLASIDGPSDNDARTDMTIE